MGESLITHIKTDDNLSDFLTKTTSGAKRRKLVSGFVQTVQDNTKLFSKCQLAGAQRVRELHERLLCPSTPDYRAIVSAGMTDRRLYAGF